MDFNKSETIRIMKLWLDWERVLDMVFDKMVEDWEQKLYAKDTEWETAKSLVEFTAKKQALIDLKKVLSAKYE